MKATYIKDAALALSLANLCLIKVWDILVGIGIDLRSRFETQNVKGLQAAILNVLILSVIFWVVVTLIRRSDSSRARETARVALLIVLLIPIYSVAVTQFPNNPFSLFTESYGRFETIALTGLVVILTAGAILQRKLIIISALVLVPVVVFSITDLVGNILILLILITYATVLWYRKRTSRIASGAILVMFPLTFLTIGQCAWWLAKVDYASHSNTNQATQMPQTRVLWLIFDEMDQRIAFTRRPEKIQLPEFDRLREQSIYATSAYPPSDFTLLSIPSLITGRFVSKAQPVSPSKVMLQYADSTEWVDWRTQPSIFNKAREAGVSTAITGWYHPYGEVVGESLNRCSAHYFASQSLGSAMYEQLLKVADILPLVSYFSSMDAAAKKRDRRRSHHTNDYLNILRDAKATATDPQMGLIMVHLPIPHVPIIYNRSSNQIVTEDGGSYLDNLVLADRALGELRLLMESAGVWEDTVVLVTSDHWWRADMWRTLRSNEQVAWTEEDEELFETVFSTGKDHRVPFLLKMAGQKTGTTYEAEFNTILTHDLILALLRGEVSDSKQVAQWIDQHRSIGESPYNFDRAK